MRASDQGPFHLFSGAVSLNDSGEVAFHTVLDSGVSGIYVSDKKATTPLALSGDVFRSPQQPVINNRGEVAFLATLANGGSGIFVGPDPVLDKVVATGDSLDGALSTDLSSSGDSTIVAKSSLRRSYATARRRLYRADPVANSSALLSVTHSAGTLPDNMTTTTPESRTPAWPSEAALDGVKGYSVSKNTDANSASEGLPPPNHFQGSSVMSVGRTCPKCQSFDVRKLSVGGDNLQGYACHDCLHVFYLGPGRPPARTDRHARGQGDASPQIQTVQTSLNAHRSKRLSCWYTRWVCPFLSRPPSCGSLT